MNDSVAQFHGYGPWVIEYLDPADDPRHSKEVRSLLK